MKKIAEFLTKSTQSTRENLGDAIRFQSLGYKLVAATLDFKDTKNVVLDATFKKGKQMFGQKFTGFSAGHGGEGPKGLATFCALFKVKGWDFNTISKLKPGKHRIK